MTSPFKVGDKVICIKKPPPGCYQCKIGAIATVKSIAYDSISTIEDICIAPTGFVSLSASYHYNLFKLLPKTISFKKLL